MNQISRLLKKLRSERKVANCVFPLVVQAAYDYYFEIIYRLVDREPTRDDEDAGHPFARHNPVGGVAGHGSMVVRDDDASFICRSPQQFGVFRLTQSSFVRRHSIKLRNAVAESAQDYLVEILIYEQTQHEMWKLSVGF